VYTGRLDLAELATL